MFHFRLLSQCVAVVVNPQCLRCRSSLLLRQFSRKAFMPCIQCIWMWKDCHFSLSARNKTDHKNGIINAWTVIYFIARTSPSLIEWLVAADFLLVTHLFLVALRFYFHFLVHKSFRNGVNESEPSPYRALFLFLFCFLLLAPSINFGRSVGFVSYFVFFFIGWNFVQKYFECAMILKCEFHYN